MLFQEAWLHKTGFVAGTQQSGLLLSKLNKLDLRAIRFQTYSTLGLGFSLATRPM